MHCEYYYDRSFFSNAWLSYHTITQVPEAIAECCEFQVLSSDNKVWSFEAASADVRYANVHVPYCGKFWLGLIFV